MNKRATIPGAPELPRGFFYRVSRNCAGPIVQIRKECSVGSKLILYSYVLVEFRDPDKAVEAACQEVFKRFSRRHTEKAREAEVIDRYWGDHGRGAA